MALSDWSERQLLALTAGVAGGILVLMAGLVLWVYSQYRSLLDEIAAKKQDVQKKEQEAEQLDDSRKKLKEATQKLDEVLKLVPSAAKLEELISQITEQSRRAGLEVQSIEPVVQRGSGRTRGKTGGSNYEPAGLTLECVGGFHEFGQFLNRLESRIERFVAIKGFKITAYSKGIVPGSKEMTFSLDIETYFYKGK